MGTNYYYEPLEVEVCPTCGHSEAHDKWHIGKSSSGWVFILHTIPERGLLSLKDWQAQWAKGGQIRDEYGTFICDKEMLSQITERSHPNGLLKFEGGVTARIKPEDPTYILSSSDFS